MSQIPQKVLSKPPFSSESRDCNLILFGLPESKSIVDTKESVDEMLEFIAGKLVIVKDMFRLGEENMIVLEGLGAPTDLVQS